MAPAKTAEQKKADKAAKDAAKAAGAATKVPGSPAQAPAVAQPKPLMSFDWAVNVIKLNRAIAFVQAGKKGLTGAALEEAVKERYAESGGLLAEDAPAPKGKKKAAGKVVNMAPDDGSEDDTDTDE